MFDLLRKYTKDGLSAAILGPVFTVFEVIFDALIPLVMKDIIDTGIYELNGDMNYIVKKGILMVLLALAAAVAGALSGLFASISSTRFVKNIRRAMFEKIQTYSFENIEKYPVPTVVMRLTTDMRMLRMAYVSIVRMLIRAPFNLLISAYFVFRISRNLSMIFLFAVPILGVGLIMIYVKAHPRFRQMMLKFDALDANLEENIEGIRVVKTFVREEHEKEKFERSSADVMKAQRFAERIVIVDRPFFELVMYICMILIAWIGGRNVISQTMTTGDFLAFLSYVRAILFALLMISNVFLQVVMAQASVDRANELLYEEPSVTDTDNDPDLEVKDGSIEFRNVSFKYSSEAEKNVLSDIDLKIWPGELIGILGPTGSSKTTLVQLIPRLYDASEGEVLVGGVNIEFAGTENKVLEDDFVTERFTNLSNTKRNLHTVRLNNVLKVCKDTLTGFRTEINQMAVVCDWSLICFEHKIELTNGCILAVFASTSRTVDVCIDESFHFIMCHCINRFSRIYIRISCNKVFD